MRKGIQKLKPFEVPLFKLFLAEIHNNIRSELSTQDETDTTDDNPLWARLTPHLQMRLIADLAIGLLCDNEPFPKFDDWGHKAAALYFTTVIETQLQMEVDSARYETGQRDNTAPMTDKQREEWHAMTDKMMLESQIFSEDEHARFHEEIDDREARGAAGELVDLEKLGKAAAREAQTMKDYPSSNWSNVPPPTANTPAFAAGLPAHARGWFELLLELMTFEKSKAAKQVVKPVWYNQWRRLVLECYWPIAAEVLGENFVGPPTDASPRAARSAGAGAGDGADRDGANDKRGFATVTNPMLIALRKKMYPAINADHMKSEPFEFAGERIIERWFPISQDDCDLLRGRLQEATQSERTGLTRPRGA